MLKSDYFHYFFISIQPSQYSKLEKADVLEMTVSCVEELLSSRHRRQAGDSGKKFQEGFRRCALEVQQYLQSLQSIPPDLSDMLSSHLDVSMNIQKTDEDSLPAKVGNMNNYVKIAPAIQPIILLLNPILPPAVPPPHTIHIQTFLSPNEGKFAFDSNGASEHNVNHPDSSVSLNINTIYTDKNNSDINPPSGLVFMQDQQGFRVSPCDSSTSQRAQLASNIKNEINKILPIYKSKDDVATSSTSMVSNDGGSSLSTKSGSASSSRVHMVSNGGGSSLSIESEWPASSVVEHLIHDKNTTATNLSKVNNDNLMKQRVSLASKFNVNVNILGCDKPNNVTDDKEAMLAEDECVHDPVWRPW